MWQYMVEDYTVSSNAELQDTLNELGQDGWELIHFRPVMDLDISSNSNAYTVEVILKRQR